jgi:hypothetical protein
VLDHHEAAAAVRLPLAPQPTDSKFNSHVKPSPSSINLILTCTLRHLLFAYMQLWSHDVDPPESREFCSLMLLSFMLCGPHPDVQSYNACFYSLPQCVRSSPQVLHTAAIAPVLSQRHHRSVVRAAGRRALFGRRAAHVPSGRPSLPLRETPCISKAQATV